MNEVQRFELFMHKHYNSEHVKYVKQIKTTKEMQSIVNNSSSGFILKKQHKCKHT